MAVDILLCAVLLRNYVIKYLCVKFPLVLLCQGEGNTCKSLTDFWGMRVISISRGAFQF